MVAEQAHLRPQLDQAADAAHEALLSIGNDDWKAVSNRIGSLPVSHLMATFLEPPNLRRSSPGRPGPHTVIAADGSQIPADRHEIAFCYVINVGTVLFPYGSED